MHTGTVVFNKIYKTKWELCDADDGQQQWVCLEAGIGTTGNYVGMKLSTNIDYPWIPSEEWEVYDDVFTNWVIEVRDETSRSESR